MIHPLHAAFHAQAKACEGLESPFMARLCTLLADRLDPDGPLGARLFGWPGDLGPMAASVPLRLCGALHALALQGRAGLAAVYPPHMATGDALWSAVAAALETEVAFIDQFLDSAPLCRADRCGALAGGAGPTAPRAVGTWGKCGIEHNLGPLCAGVAGADPRPG